MNVARVHQRGGMLDAMLYNVTLAILIAGFVEYLRVVYTLVYGAAKE